MKSPSVILFITFGYLGLCLVLGLLPSRKSSATAQGFVAGDRSFGLLLMYFITGATIFSSFAFLGAPGWAYSRGAAAFYILAYGTLGFLPFYFIGPRAQRVGKAYGFVTQAEMVAYRFSSPFLSFIMALVSVFAFIPYLALQMKGAGYVLSNVTNGGLPEWAGAAIVYGAVLIYVEASGVLGVGWTNTFQGIFMMALAWGLGLYLPYRLYGGTGPMFEGIAEKNPLLLLPPGLDAQGNPWTWGEFSSAVIISVIGFSFWPHLFMKAFTARSERILKKTVVLYPTFQVFLVPIFLIGFAGVLFHPAPEKADHILPHILMHMEISPLIVGLFCAGALAASMSSGDAMAHACASIIVRDAMVSFLGFRPGKKEERAWIRLALLLVMLSSYILALSYHGSLVMLLLSAYGGIIQFVPVVFASLYLEKTSKGSLTAGLVAGTILTAFFMARPETRPFKVHPGMFGLFVNFLIVIAGNAVFAGNPGQKEVEFLESAMGNPLSSSNKGI